MTFQKPIFDLFCLCSLDSRHTVSEPCSKRVKLHNFFFFFLLTLVRWALLHFIPLSYTGCSWNFKSSSSSSSRADSKDSHGFLSSSVSIIHRPQQVFQTTSTSVAQGLVLDGTSSRAVAQTHLASTKISRFPSAFLWKGAPQAISLDPLRRVRAWGKTPWCLMMPVLARSTWMLASRKPFQIASTDCHPSQDTPEQNLLILGFLLIYGIMLLGWKISKNSVLYSDNYFWKRETQKRKQKKKKRKSKSKKTQKKVSKSRNHRFKTFEGRNKNIYTQVTSLENLREIIAIFSLGENVNLNLNLNLRFLQVKTNDFRLILHDFIMKKFRPFIDADSILCRGIRPTSQNRGVLGMTINTSSCVALRNMKYLFIGITPESTLTRSDCTYKGPIKGSNRSV